MNEATLKEILAPYNNDKVAAHYLNLCTTCQRNFAVCKATCVFISDLLNIKDDSVIVCNKYKKE